MLGTIGITAYFMKLKSIPLIFLLIIVIWTCGSDTTYSNKNFTSKSVAIIPVDTIVSYPWLNAGTEMDNIANRFLSEDGYHREVVAMGSFSSWLRHLPLLPSKASVLLYNGELKKNQNAHAAIINIDVGQSDLQQCADAVIRLRAEYLFSIKKYKSIAFHYTSGNLADYSDWCKGKRLVVNGNKISVSENGKQYSISAHESLQLFLNEVFQYAGTLSLSRELKSVPISEMQIGDVFIRGGSPGHACIVGDMLVDDRGQKNFVLIQSYMPAQQMHVLRNPEKENKDPWFSLDFGETLHTPEWDFTADQLKRFE